MFAQKKAQYLTLAHFGLPGEFPVLLGLHVKSLESSLDPYQAESIVRQVPAQASLGIQDKLRITSFGMQEVGRDSCITLSPVTLLPANHMF
jgi:hypothetical protein